MDNYESFIMLPKSNALISPPFADLQLKHEEKAKEPSEFVQDNEKV